ncbi:expressed unknown protein [Seminavis robusta]|uniref:Uncharacterized protein n=1 Tax=Seminavis robusta TaxID=568900 RepID=A0A9N8DSJ3_9STRA|nr:expressed unknown protein [Seminavis robusta]|eukprot:Sro220_g090680.1 n/a (145) ;mRNA; f:22184-22618
MEQAEYQSYRGLHTLSSATVFGFLQGAMMGAVWGCFTPYYPMGSLEAIRQANTGQFRPAPVFGSMGSVTSNALWLGSILAVQRLGASTAELTRKKTDVWNDLFGVACVFPYGKLFLDTERKVILHNRAIAGLIVLSTAYTSFIA